LLDAAAWVVIRYETDGGGAMALSMSERRDAGRIGATIEARMTSTRLPGKCLRPVLGKPTLELMIERLKRVPSLDRIVLATTTNATGRLRPHREDLPSPRRRRDLAGGLRVTALASRSTLSVRSRRR